MRSPFDLSGKTVLVTGASSGIGQACCELLAAMGASVVLTGRNAERTQQTFEKLEGAGKHVPISADLCDPGDLRKLVDGTSQIDGLVLAAGFVNSTLIKFYTEDTIQKHFSINYFAQLALTREILKKKKMNSGGSIVGISSVSALFGVPANGIYAGTKAALIATLRVLALELASAKIRVNCVSPAQVRSPMTDKVSEHLSEEAMVAYEKQYPLGFGVPSDVAAAVSYLLADASRWVTGTNMILDGGYTCR